MCMANADPEDWLCARRGQYAIADCQVFNGYLAIRRADIRSAQKAHRLGGGKEERIDGRGDRFISRVGELKACCTGRACEVTLKGDIGELCIGAVVGIRGTEHAIETCAYALQIEEIAQVRIEVDCRRAVVFRGQHSIVCCREVIRRRQKMLRQPVCRGIIIVI